MAGVDPALLPPMSVPWQFDYTSPEQYQLAIRLYIQSLATRMDYLKSKGERHDSFVLCQLIHADNKQLQENAS